MANPAKQINRFFAKHGSPVAGMGNVFVKASRRYGINPYQLAAHVMAETEGGLTGTGRRGQYNLTGMGGVGHMKSYPNWQASIIDSARNLGSPRYKGKPLGVQAAMWVAGTGPSAKTRPYANTLFKYMKMMGGSPNYREVSGVGRGQGKRDPRFRTAPMTAQRGGIQPIGGSLAPMLQNLLTQMSGVPELGAVMGMLMPAQGRMQKMKSGKGGPSDHIPVNTGNMPDKIFTLLHYAKVSDRKSPGYSKATRRGPLGGIKFNEMMDCSLSVAKLLSTAGLGFGPGSSAPVSGQMAKSWGKPGKGRHLTMWASNDHVFLEIKIKGKYYRFDTSPHSDPDQRRGPRIRRTKRSTAGFTPRHWPGL